MNDELRQRVIETLRRGEELPAEWARELFPPERREYELVYYGKEREEDIVANTMAVPLQPVRNFGRNGEDWCNKLILGDNIQVLRTLLKMKDAGELVNPDGALGVKLVYIDPPFATKREFQGSQEERAYNDKIAGAEFIEFLRKRLVLIHRLLAPNGSLFVHLDQRKVHYLKAILDELFGEHNFRNEIILPGRASKNLQQQFETISRLNIRHDTLLWYSKSAATRFSPLWIEKHDAGNPEGHWHHFWSTADRKGMRYELFGITPETGQWTWKEKKAKEAIKNYERYLSENGGRTLAEYWRDTGSVLRFIRQDPEDGKPQYWRPPAETRIADTVWSGVPLYSSGFNYPTEKNEALLTQIVEFGSDEGDIVLDAFAGSGTTLAAAEKLGRRWIGIDRGNLAIYTIQKRLLNLTKTEGKKESPIKPKPFTFYNAGLYDFSTLQQLPWDDWRFFALQLFECKDERHQIGGMWLDGKRKGASVLVFDHFQYAGQRIDEETVYSIHSQIGDKIGSRFFIIAPRNVFDFQQDFIDFDNVRYYALRIPYSFINELHRREFTALSQPKTEADINNLMETEGFDFIQAPEVFWTTGFAAREGRLLGEAFIRLDSFDSRAYIRGGKSQGGLETFSMLLLDFDYDGEVFHLDACFFADQLERENWYAWFPKETIGANVMAIFMDIYGNEAVEVVSREKFDLTPLPEVTERE